MAVYSGHSAHWERGIVKHAEVGCVFFFPFLIGVYLLYNTVLFSPVQQSEPVTHIHISHLFWVSFLQMTLGVTRFLKSLHTLKCMSLNCALLLMSTPIGPIL